MNMPMVARTNRVVTMTIPQNPSSEDFAPFAAAWAGIFRTDRMSLMAVMATKLALMAMLMIDPAALSSSFSWMGGIWVISQAMPKRT
jgi:hypothetical protein